MVEGQKEAEGRRFRGKSEWTNRAKAGQNGGPSAAYRLLRWPS